MIARRLQANCGNPAAIGGMWRREACPCAIRRASLRRTEIPRDKRPFEAHVSLVLLFLPIEYIAMSQSRDDCPPPARPEPLLPVDLRGLDWTAALVFAVLLALGMLVGHDAVTNTRATLRAPVTEAQAAALP